MIKNIPWSSLTGSQIREVVRMWPELPAFITGGKSQIVVQAAQVPVVNLKVAPVPASKLKGMPKVSQRQKHTGADGEVKFVEHRNIWIGFFGGRAVIKRSTAEACREALKAQFGAVHQG